MVDHLNFFEPFENLPHHHENQLTRALLVLLRYCPAAHQAWLSLIDPGKKLHQLPRARFQTQRAQVLESGSGAATNEEIPGISVLCSADVTLAESIILESDRGQVLDGIIRYENDLVIVLESKLDGPCSDRQAREINLHGQPIKFEGKVRRLSWRDLLDTFDQLANEARGVTSGAEQWLLQDFLGFVDRHFPRLGPFSTLDRCKGEPSRVMRRLIGAISEAVEGDPLNDGALLPGRHLAVVSTHVGCNTDTENRSVLLGLYPADTLQQARTFYAKRDAPDKVLSLRSMGWNVVPNFHFGFMAKGLTWTHATAAVEDYVRHWKDQVGKMKQLRKAEWPGFWEKLIRLGFAKDSDREQFDRDFSSTNRSFASVRPGLSCQLSWPLAQAEKLDAAGKFIPELRRRVNEVLAAVEEPLLEKSGD